MSGPFRPSGVQTNPINLLLFDNSLVNQRLFACWLALTVLFAVSLFVDAGSWGVFQICDQNDQQGSPRLKE